MTRKMGLWPSNEISQTTVEKKMIFLFILINHILILYLLDIYSTIFSLNNDNNVISFLNNIE